MHSGPSLSPLLVCPSHTKHLPPRPMHLLLPAWSPPSWGQPIGPILEFQFCPGVWRCPRIGVSKATLMLLIQGVLSYSHWFRSHARRPLQACEQLPGVDGACRTDLPQVLPPAVLRGEDRSKPTSQTEDFSLNIFNWFMTSQVALVVKNPPANAGGMGYVGLIPVSGRSPGRGNGSPLQYSHG